MSENIVCPISNQPMNKVFSETVMGKYPAAYYFCPESGLLKTEDPYWLDEAYEEAINDTDIGLVMRNMENSKRMEVILTALSMGKGLLLDVSGGYGLFARMMRDRGFDCYTTDKYCENIFAKSFEPEEGFKADVLFCFEVLEHLVDPVAFLQEVFDRYQCRTIIFSTTTFEGSIPALDWPYYAFEHGQHISFYQPRTLKLLADRLNCNYIGISNTLHIITEQDISPLRRLLIINRYVRKLYSFFVAIKRRRMSRIESDVLLIKQSSRV